MSAALIRRGQSILRELHLRADLAELYSSSPDEIQYKLDFQWHWVAIAGSGLKAPLLNCSDGLVVESFSARLSNRYVLRPAMNIDDK